MFVIKTVCVLEWTEVAVLTLMLSDSNRWDLPPEISKYLWVFFIDERFFNESIWHFEQKITFVNGIWLTSLSVNPYINIKHRKNPIEWHSWLESFFCDSLTFCLPAFRPRLFNFFLTLPPIVKNISVWYAFVRSL